MAKQSGLHQLKGKVDGYSYYRQSGVKAGLMRRINEGMSARVKSSEEFANTRLNNSEFGNAADVAKVIASQITPKFRPMFLNFSQAKLTKSLLALIKQAEGDWGKRALSADDVAAICDGVNMLAKNDFSQFVGVFSTTAGDESGTSDLHYGVNQDNIDNLAAAGADGVKVAIYSLVLYAGQYSADAHGYVKSLSVRLWSANASYAVEDGGTSTDVTLTPEADDIASTAKIFAVLAVAMPYRTINLKDHILQEKCTFKMIPTIINAGA